MSESLLTYRWFPLVGGLGWGRIRLSLLFKPVDIRLPPGISGFEVSTLEIRALASTDLSNSSDKLSMIIETEADQCKLNYPMTGTTQSRISLDSVRTSNTFKTMLDPNTSSETDWDIGRPIRLAVEYRHSCSILLSFVSKLSVLKRKVIGLAIIRLNDVADAEIVERTVPIFNTDNVKEAMKASYSYHPPHDEGIGDDARSTRRVDSPCKPIGFVRIKFVLHPGLSRVHKKLCKKDLRFRKIYEAWEIGNEMNQDISRVTGGEVLTKRMQHGEDRMKGQDDDRGDESDVDEGDSDEDREINDNEWIEGRDLDDREDITLDDDEEETQGYLARKREHSEALHKRVRAEPKAFLS